MKKVFALLAVVALFGLVPLFASAGPSPTPDGAECATGTSGVTTEAASGQPDRGAVCVNDGSGNVVLYAGGEAVVDEADDEDGDGMSDQGGTCGAAIVGGTTLSGDPDWHQDHVHDPTPNQPNSGDETTHHHDCE